MYMPYLITRKNVLIFKLYAMLDRKNLLLHQLEVSLFTYQFATSINASEPISQFLPPSHALYPVTPVNAASECCCVRNPKSGNLTGKADALDSL
jgi:hypothetical protein